ncbi:MAG: peptide deformylase [Candidatus Vogelbacteria bacterium]|nr:peptide deformylase [Candidatus Vogelbacteria bacterium]
MKILQKSDRRLRQISKPVPPEEIGSQTVQDILARMSRVLATQADGVALAAPQIGEHLRLFIVGGEPELVFINPEITKLSKKKHLVEEGCLSVRWLYGEVKRAEKVRVTAYDAAGKKFVRHASGLMAQIFQHEIDHLDGILFIDKAKNLHEIKPEHD